MAVTLATTYAARILVRTLQIVPSKDTTSDHDPSTVAVLIPVKSFRAAKHRLAAALDEHARAVLAREMATTVVAAARHLRVAVVCDDDEVAGWAAEQGAMVIAQPGRGLNNAVTDGVTHLAARGFTRVIVAHADLPHALDLTWVADFDGVTLVPDRRDDGSNVVCVPASTGFRFSYGRGSFRRHADEARRLGLALRVEREPRLGWDVDVPADLDDPRWSSDHPGARSLTERR
jgi:2-phospho-L-lactate guanylyltransferase